MVIKALREPVLSPRHEALVYQVEAVEAVKDLPYSAVFHEQGLGKTKIGIDLSLYWLVKDIVDSVLVVTKKGLVPNWQDELGIHTYVTPRLLCQDRRANFLAFNSPARIYLSYYEVIKSECSRLLLFLKTRRVAVVLDEAHKIKNPDSSIAKALFQLSPYFSKKTILTGTPIANRPYDLWSQIYFLDQGKSLGGDYKSFRAELDLTNDLVRSSDKAARFEKALEAMFMKVQPFSVRETKRTAGLCLPEKVIRNVFVKMEGRQAEIYKSFRDDFAMIIVRSGIPRMDKADDILKRLLRLVQVASNPELVDEAYHLIPGKLPVLQDCLDEVIDRGEKAIVWTSFIHNVDWLYRELKHMSPVRVHGKMAHEARQQSITSFKTDPKCAVLIATPASAKEGLTLTVANNAIFYDRSFSLDDYLQAQDRIHRISQTKACTVTNLIASDTVDEWVDVLLAAKQLAAQLGQGDITRDQYREKADYEFGEMLREITQSSGGVNGNPSN